MTEVCMDDTVYESKVARPPWYRRLKWKIRHYVNVKLGLGKYRYRAEAWYRLARLFVTGETRHRIEWTSVKSGKNAKLAISESFDHRGFALKYVPSIRLYRRWLKFVIPYLRHYTKEPDYGHENYFSNAWRLVCKGNRIRTNMPLPVLNSSVDAPCEGCNGRCCSTPPGTRGFSVVVIQTWEQFAKLNAGDCVPSPRTPGELFFKFDRKPDGSYRCRHLSDDGRCGVHAHRPMACRAFACTDGLSPHSRRYLGSDFLRTSKDVRDRLVGLGFKVLPGADGDY